MPPIAKTGPYAKLPSNARRLGRGGMAFAQGGLPGLNAGDFLGHVSAVSWTASAEQVSIPIPGEWRNQQVPGVETRTGTLRYQDVDDYFRMLMHRFFKARKDGDFSVLAPAFDVQTVLVGGPQESNWILETCRIYGMDGGYDTTTDLLDRELQFTFEDERPANAFQYTGTDSSGNPITTNYPAE